MSLTVGILGFGYLGKELMHVLGTHAKVWVTKQQATQEVIPGGSSLQAFTFHWMQSGTWSNLPDNEAVLIITIPPTHDNLQGERQHLKNWCEWIHANRPGYKRCVYISTTGVYPNQPGNWSESHTFDCDSLKGELRLLSEHILSEYFELVVIRPGAIYGRARNIGHRILAGKPIPKGEQPVHRIHVHDLAILVQKAVFSHDFPRIINAVDLESATSKKVLDWLVTQSFFPAIDDHAIKYTEDFQTRKFNLTQPERKISNQLLTKSLGFSFVYPTYKEGLAHAFSQEYNDKQK